MTSSPRIVSPSTDTATELDTRMLTMIPKDAPPIRMPKGYEPLPAKDATRLAFGNAVAVLECATGEVYSGLVRGVKPGRIRVVFGNDHIEGFYVSYRDHRDDGERGATMSGLMDYMLIQQPEAELFNALKASTQLAALQQQVHHISNFAQALPTLEQYADLKETVDALRGEVAALRRALVARVA